MVPHLGFEPRTHCLRGSYSDLTELMRYIGDPDGARTRKLQRERLMTIPVCLQDLKALRSANRTSVLVGVFANPMVGRVGLEPTCFQ